MPYNFIFRRIYPLYCSKIRVLFKSCAAFFQLRSDHRLTGWMPVHSCGIQLEISKALFHLIKRLYDCLWNRNYAVGQNLYAGVNGFFHGSGNRFSLQIHLRKLPHCFRNNTVLYQFSCCGIFHRIKRFHLTIQFRNTARGK